MKKLLAFLTILFLWASLAHSTVVEYGWIEYNVVQQRSRIMSASAVELGYMTYDERTGRTKIYLDTDAVGISVPAGCLDGYTLIYSSASGKFDSCGSPGGAASISDLAYGAGWDGVTDTAGSKNAIHDLIMALIGGASGATNLGTFTGSTIPDNQPVKPALQALETAVEGKAASDHNHTGTYEPVDATILKQADVDDAPVDGVTTAPISSNWAYDHVAAVDPHTGYLPKAGGTLTGALIFDPTVTGILQDFRLATEWTGGTILNAAFASGVTPASNIFGVVLDFSTNLTMTATKEITGFQIKTPAFTQSSANTTNYVGFDLPAAGALISQNNASSEINWKGLNIQMPNITQTQGAVNSYGIYVNGGTVTSGTQYAIFVDSGNVRLDGSLGDTTNRVVKGWFTDLEITNSIVLPDGTTATTQSASDNSTKIATTAYADAAAGAVSTHTQNTDTGTTSSTFCIQTGTASGTCFKYNSGTIEVVTGADTAVYAGFKASSFTVPKTSGQAGSNILNEAATTSTLGVGWMGPADLTDSESFFFQHSNAQPTAGQVMAFAVPTGAGGPGGEKVSAQTWINPVKTSDVIKIASFAWDGGGSAVTADAASERCTIVPHGATITGYHMRVSGDPGAGGTILNVHKDAFNDTTRPSTAMDGTGHNYPPTVVDNKTAINDTTITGWTTTVTANDEICALVATNAVATWITFTIYGTR